MPVYPECSTRSLRYADAKIGGLVLLDVPARVARLLVQMADENDGQQILKPPTHHTMAQMVGSSRETVSRAISHLVSQGVIEVSRKKLAILNREALVKAAGKDSAGRMKGRAGGPEGQAERRRASGARDASPAGTPPGDRFSAG